MMPPVAPWCRAASTTHRLRAAATPKGRRRDHAAPAVSTTLPGPPIPVEYGESSEFGGGGGSPGGRRGPAQPARLHPAADGAVARPAWPFGHGTPGHALRDLRGVLRQARDP